MRWTVEADTARDVVSWPEEVNDFRGALHSGAENASCRVDPIAGSLSTRFQVSADRQEDAEAAARRVMTEELDGVEPKSIGELRFVGADPLEEALGVLAADEELDGPAECQTGVCRIPRS
jgi:hypothetical protein